MIAPLRLLIQRFLLPFGAPVALVIAGILLYGDQLAGPFFFDDESSIVANPHIRQLWPPTWAEPQTPGLMPINSRPLTSLSLACNYALAELDPHGYHAFNLAIHILVALALYALLYLSAIQMASPQAHSAAFLGSLLWLIHPLTSQCVHYATQRSESLMALFYLLTIYGVGRAALGHSRWWKSAALISCTLGMLSKEVMLTAPVAALLYDRCFCSGGWGAALRRNSWLYVGLAATWLIPLKFLSTNPHGMHADLIDPLSWSNYGLNQFAVVWGYLSKAVWPQSLTIDYGPARSVAWGDIWTQATALLLLLAFAALALWKWPKVGFALAVFFVVLAPTSSIVPINNEVGAERRAYLPLAALAGLVALGGHYWLSAQGRIWRRAVLVAFCAWMVWLAATTRARSHDFASLVTLWETAVGAVPNNPRAHAQLADALAAEGRFAESIHHYKQALSEWPELGLAHRGLAAALAELGRSEEAADHYARAIEYMPGFAAIHLELARQLDLCERRDAALIHYKKAVELAPQHAKMRGELANALLERKDFTEALAQYGEALRLDETIAQVHNNIGICLGAMRRYEEAIAHFQRALELDHSHAEARHNLRAALFYKVETDR